MNATRSQIIRVIFFLTLAAVLYLALMPNSGRSRFRIVPEPLYRWLESPLHDDFGNITAFGFLAFLSFFCQARPVLWKKIAGTGALARLFANRIALLAALLAMIVTIEILQIWIPGRVSELQDVCTGWSGIFAAWLLAELLDANRGKPGGG